MLKQIDLGKQVPRAEYRQVFPSLETRLAACQRTARAMGVPVIVVFEGWDAAGKGHLINRLTQVLDPRGFKVHVTSAPDEDERRHPWLWRFWRSAPAAGTLTIFDRSWYGRVLVERVDKVIPKPEWRRAFDEIRQFERQLADSGAVIVKFWLHISRKEQRKRFKEITANPSTAWKVGREEWRRHMQYKAWAEAADEMLRRTGTDQAPWTVVEATHLRFARKKVFETLVAAMEGENARRAATPDLPRRPMPVPQRPPAGANGWRPPRSHVPFKPCSPESVATEPSSNGRGRIGGSSRTVRLDRVDLSLTIDRQKYQGKLARLQKRIFSLEHELYVAQVPALIVYEGFDAGGKGGAIKRLTRGLDPRGYEVVPTGAPTAEEKAHHYLWRFWNRVPKAGHITIFDRSWYGRVLVERVEGFCTEAEWQRAYREINEFEKQLADFGTVIVKLWLHIDRDEQLRRFQARQEDPTKQWKITDEDWRNREKWPQYEAAVTDMLERTHTKYAPWTILEANCKLHARLKALRTVADALERALAGAK